MVEEEGKISGEGTGTGTGALLVQSVQPSPSKVKSLSISLPPATVANERDSPRSPCPLLLTRKYARGRVLVQILHTAIE